MHHIRLKCGLSAFFFERLAHRLVGQRVHIGEFDHAPGQQAQCPAPAPCRRGRTGERDEVGLLRAVELALVDALAAPVRVQRCREALFDKALADTLHGRDADIECLGDARVRPRGSAFGLIGLEQNLGVLEPAHVSLAVCQQAPEFVALGWSERHPVHLVHGQSPVSACSVRDRNAQLTPSALTNH
jgi:hypothetical protein